MKSTGHVQTRVLLSSIKKYSRFVIEASRCPPMRIDWTLALISNWLALKAGVGSETKREREMRGGNYASVYNLWGENTPLAWEPEWFVLTKSLSTHIRLGKQKRSGADPVLRPVQWSGDRGIIWSKSARTHTSPGVRAFTPEHNGQNNMLFQKWLFKINIWTQHYKCFLFVCLFIYLLLEPNPKRIKPILQVYNHFSMVILPV